MILIQFPLGNQRLGPPGKGPFSKKLRSKSSHPAYRLCFKF